MVLHDTTIDKSLGRLEIGNDDLLRIAFWESQCAVIRVGISVDKQQNHNDLALSVSLNAAAQKLWGFTHEELNEFAKQFRQGPQESLASKLGQPVPFIWRLFSHRSFASISHSMVGRHMQNLSQLRIDLEVVTRNGQHIPCRSCWKYRAHPNGFINDVIIAVKPL